MPNIDEDDRRSSPTRHAWRILSRIAIPAILFAVLSLLPAAAQQTDPTPPQIQELVRILNDPAVKAWLAAHQAAAPADQKASAESADDASTSPSGYMAGRMATLHARLMELAAAWPTLPDQFAVAVAMLSDTMHQSGDQRILALIGLSVLLGIVGEALVRYSVGGFMRWVKARPLETARQRLEAAGLRLAYGAALVFAFALGSFALFAVSDWPPLLREIVLGYLVAVIVARAALALCTFLTAPEDARFRLLPVDNASAVYWCRRTVIVIGWFAFGWVTATLLSKLGFTMAGRHLVAYMLGLILFTLCLEAIWRRPALAPAAADAGESSTPVGSRPSRRMTANLLLSGYLLLIWVLWAGGMMPAFWLVAIAFILRSSIRIVGSAVAYFTKPADAATPESQASTAYRVLAERGVRALLIITAALLLAHAWGLDMASLAATDTVATRLLRGAVSAVIIALLADVAWRIIRAVIDSKLTEPVGAARTRSRIRTLLPILRNVLFVVLLTMAGLMVLSAMGVQIGPLIAGAGVVGVAIGFGAQTLVKDIISGVFYLLDDAFRVGEYIQSGSYKGTVESFSLRSVKLRHHRGPLYTVPFGELGAVQNMSRDWVIDKMMVGITYDSDLEKARKIIKQIGKDLAADPDFAPHIIEPLKMQGVEQFGDYAIQIRMKMMTKPNEQFTIRRKALAMIKKAFDANNIKFAFPTVQVAGGTDSGIAAAAQQAIANANAAAAADQP